MIIDGANTLACLRYHEQVESIVHAPSVLTSPPPRPPPNNKGRHSEAVEGSLHARWVRACAGVCMRDRVFCVLLLTERTLHAVMARVWRGSASTNERWQ